MAGHAITVSLPESVYEQIQEAARRAKRPVHDVLTEAVAAVAPVIDTAPQELRSALAQMAYLNDAALWQAARATMTKVQRERLEELHHKQQRTSSLTSEEVSEEQALLQLYKETILIRAQAALLLKQRGYDISDLEQFTPLE
ncbi:MAG: hypothetical protein L0332_02455 [Chloroflexi bacterium]|nr:hypothetical protein [Chloroflexota bacterium]MCI0577500.1 hypothetical protein [Chloroflexota bacterium]MCI0645662.1 hypothetical protein [Chloroflexota bacterium]MCI0725574.1 hypothetical protein [Chloroflexota bacterium]